VSGFSGTVHLSVHWLLRWLSSTSRLPVFAIPLTGPQDSESRRSGFAEMAAPAEAAAVPLSSSSRACERRGAQPVKGTSAGGWGGQSRSDNTAPRALTGCATCLESRGRTRTRGTGSGGEWRRGETLRGERPSRLRRDTTARPSGRRAKRKKAPR
jgi:hypothetical protein